MVNREFYNKKRNINLKETIIFMTHFVDMYYDILIYITFFSNLLCIFAYIHCVSFIDNASFV